MKQRKRKPRVYAYCRVSTSNQTIDSQRLQILEYARKNSLSIHDFITCESSSQKTKKDRKLDILFDTLQTGDLLLVAELSRLGRSLTEILVMIEEQFRKRKIDLICLKERLEIREGKQDLHAKILVTLLGLLTEAERYLIRERVLFGLQVARKKGRKGGRRKGELQKSLLDPKQEEVQTLLNLGVPVTEIARTLGVKVPTLRYFIRTRKMKREGKPTTAIRSLLERREPESKRTS